MSDSPDHSATSQTESPKPRLGAWLVAVIVAFAVGGGVGVAVAGGIEPEVVTEEVEVEPAELVERREALDARESLLDDRGETLSSRSSDLDEREESLNETEGTIEEREAAVAELELNLEENSIPGSGTFLVGEDVEPGVYRTLGSRDCWWERLAGLSGEYNDVIATGVSDGPVYVTISETDVAFHTDQCADWVRQ